MTPAGSVPREITRLRAPSIACAVVGAALMLIGLVFSPDNFFRSYLVAWLFVLGISMGSLAFIMMGHLVDSEWAWLIRRIGEAAALNLVLVAVLFIPILFGLKQLFPWAHPELVRHDPILIHKSVYLNAKWFTIRAAAYFIIWMILATWTRRQSIEHDRTGDRKSIESAQRASAPGLVLFVLTMTLASVDWILSRDAHWYSTIIGFSVVIGQALAGLAFMIWILTLIAGRDPVAPVIEKKHLNDFGNLFLTLVILWAYMSFAQLLVIWMGNSREDNSWYLERGFGLMANGWRWLGLFLITFHFFVPFFILLSRDNKRRVEFMKKLAIWLLLMRFVDMVWMIIPTGGRGFTPMVVPAVLMIGGIWLVSFVAIVQKQPLLPGHSPLVPGGHHGHEPLNPGAVNPDAGDAQPAT